MNETDIKQHIFQTAGLGLAPYTFSGVTEASSTCDYCGTPIHYEFHLRSADRFKFKVGSDCIHKAGDAGLQVHVAEHKSKLRKAAALARKHADTARRIALGVEIIAFLEKHIAIFLGTHHPHGGWDYVANAPRNWFDYGVFMSRHSKLPALEKLFADAIKIQEDFSQKKLNRAL